MATKLEGWAGLATSVGSLFFAASLMKYKVGLDVISDVK